VFLSTLAYGAGKQAWQCFLTALAADVHMLLYSTDKGMNPAGQHSAT
jgi:hypothetical protein